MPVTLKVEGVPEAVAALRKVAAALSSERIQDCLMTGAKVIRDRAKQLVKLGPGKARGIERAHLRDLIFAARGRKQASAGPSVIVGVDRKKAPHSHLVELGHGGPHPAPPHPFLRPAMDASKRDVPTLIEAEMKRVLQSAGIDTK